MSRPSLPVTPTQEGAYRRVLKGEYTNELIAAAATYEAAVVWRDFYAYKGKSETFILGKGFLNGAAEYFIDQTVEINGLDFIDISTVKNEARQQLTELLHICKDEENGFLL